ncbi:outer membrane beta-barrel protein [Dyadobacter sp. CY312]|uniref:outer membrane beta-barrel protein n=1 Tax=Dyadobacter sp. CY312 TaxID=2907303 RepID=UPI001F35A3A5|nr:outer membrane beta-barrel protein [Dyadobacter sp. CY312]MCE7038770.1 PorT family protein [Dyadobacter sp. CY312]
MRITFTCVLLLFYLSSSAQTFVSDSSSSKAGKYLKENLAFKVGGAVSSFAHNGGIEAPVPGSKSLISWHAGLVMDMFRKKHYQTRVELSYITKGARETFGNDRIEIESVNKLQYIQLSILPLILKTNLGKVSPYIGLGGYYAQRVGIKSKWKPGAEWEDDAIAAGNLDKKNDVGYSVSVGVYVRKKSFAELRYDGGLNAVSSTSNIKNRTLTLSIAL